MDTHERPQRPDRLRSRIERFTHARYVGWIDAERGHDQTDCPFRANGEVSGLYHGWLAGWHEQKSRVGY